MENQSPEETKKEIANAPADVPEPAIRKSEPIGPGAPRGIAHDPQSVADPAPPA
jgi:hypothetical protein